MKETRVQSCTIAIVFLLLGVMARTGWSQAYQFTVPQMDLQVYVQPDASARLEYRIVFKNLAGAHPIDVVDVGLPHRNYDIKNMSASINGTPLTGIQKSTYISIGVEVQLGSLAIPPGGKASFALSALCLTWSILTLRTRPTRACKSFRHGLILNHNLAEQYLRGQFTFCPP